MSDKEYTSGIADTDPKVGFISDAAALEIANKIFGPAEFDHFKRTMEQMRHLQECIETNTPSPRCRRSDPVENLKWCRLGLRIEEQEFCEYLQRIIDHRN
jgi:hypothetical protein